jgi:hypothetical protein
MIFIHIHLIWKGKRDLKCPKCNMENNGYVKKCKYCGERFVPLDQTKRELKYCECGCPAPLTNGRGYCVNCKEDVHSSELY